MSHESVAVVIVGAGFAGAATAWALGCRGVGPVLVLEREDVPGFHASGRNAAILRVTESESVVRRLGLDSVRRIRELEAFRGELLRNVGGLLLASGNRAQRFTSEAAGYRAEGLEVEVLTAATARERFPIVGPLRFDAALWCPHDGTIDIHLLLLRFLERARETGGALRLRTEVEGLLVEGGRVRGVVTPTGTIRADAVVDAGGAWAGRWRRREALTPLPLRPLRRHIVVSGALDGIDPSAPFAWHLDEGFYLRSEGEGLLLSPCDETLHPAAAPVPDPAALELLESKLQRGAPALAEVLTVRASWPCLRTFAPDRLPVVGPDPELPGLFHVSALGGFGVTTSAATGEIAAALVVGERPAAVDAAEIAPSRLALGREVAAGP